MQASLGALKQKISFTVRYVDREEKKEEAESDAEKDEKDELEKPTEESGDWNSLNDQ